MRKNSYLKGLLKNKLHSTITILSLSISLTFVLLLGIYVKQEFSVDEFHENKSRIFLLARDNNKASFANPIPDLIKENCPEVEAYTRIISTNMSVLHKSGSKVNVRSLFADSSFFHIFSFNFIDGDPSNALSTSSSVVITKTFARKYFENENPIGKIINVSENFSLVVSAVIDDFSNFTQIPKSDLIINYNEIGEIWGRDILKSYDNSSFGMYFMAHSGADLTEKDSVILNLFHETNYTLYTEGYANEVRFIPLTSVYFSDVDTAFANIRTGNKALVFLYLIIALFILLVSIVNYINLTVSQIDKRARQIAIKRIVGCNNTEIVKLFILESIITTFLAFCIALIFALFSERFVNLALNTQLNLRSHFLEISFLNGIVILVSIVGLVSGIVPALVISRLNPIDVVKGNYTFKIKTLHSKILITFQYVFTFTLLACNIFITKQTREMLSLDMGFNGQNVLVLDNVVELDRYQALKSLFASIPGVEEVSFSTGTPVDGGINNSFDYNGQILNVQQYYVDSSFFELLDIKVDYTEMPRHRNTIFLNKEAYRALKPSKDIVEIDKNNVFSVGGIIENLHFRSLHEGPELIMIQFLDPNREAWSILIKIKSSDEKEVTDKIKSAYLNFNGGEPFDVKLVKEEINSWYKKENATLKILFYFTVLTITILIMGIFAMSLYFTQQREKEVAIRKVNGATKSNIFFILIYDFLYWINLAFLVSIPIVICIMEKWLENYSYKTKLNGWVFLSTYLIVAIVSIVSISAQSTKAANSDPVKLLNQN